MSTIFLQHHEDSPPGSAVEVLRSHGHAIRVIRTFAGDPVPTTLDGITGIVSCGGAQSVLDSDAAMEAEYALLREAHERQVPVLGLCLGAQMLAHALGGEVGRLPDGPEVGFHEVGLTPAGREDPMFKGIPWWTQQFQWHEDGIVSAPPDARILAAGRRVPVQVFAVGTSSYGIQYHPEYTRDLVDEHCRRSDAMAAAGGGPEALARQAGEEFPDFERHALRFFESVALFLMPLDRMSAGIAKDVRH